MGTVTEASSPPRPFILPQDGSLEARIITLPNPRTTNPIRYYCCPVNGIYEFTKIAVPSTMPRSWLLAPSRTSTITKSDGSQKNVDSGPSASEHAELKTTSLSRGYITKSADLFVATPIDPLFLVLPAMSSALTSAKSGPVRKHFLSADDLFERIICSADDFSFILEHASTRTSIERRMRAVCDTVKAGGDTMYRLSMDKLLGALLEKAERIVAKGLPTSLEEHFVRNALEVPMTCINHKDSSISISDRDVEEAPSMPDTSLETSSVSTNSQQTDISFTNTSTSATSISTNSSDILDPPMKTTPVSAPDGVPYLLRLRTALSYLLSSYLPPHISATLQNCLSTSDSPIDFKPLDRHLSHLGTLRAQALASRSLSNFSRKRSFNEEEEGAETRAEKKWKKDEEERKKRLGESRGVRNLKKVDTSGMRKMSDFFGKGSVKMK
ncbi:MAG: hypothetical protein M1827_002790 [Pycnora praestabilis]|nr:MAG: hypothetical protein M1827_002790 [Pycnora praestabilis]